MTTRRDTIRRRFVQFFERLKAEEKKKHSKIAKMFSTHPMNADRITAAQAEIRKYLPDRDSYVVDTSEFEAMKARLIACRVGCSMHVEKGGNRPVLRKARSVAMAREIQELPIRRAASPDKSDGPPVLKTVPAVRTKIPAWTSPVPTHDCSR